MKKALAFILLTAMLLSMCVPAIAAPKREGYPVYITVFGLNQLNRNHIFAMTSAGKIEFVQVWDGGKIMKDGKLEPNHEYNLLVRVKYVDVKLNGGHPLIFTNGKTGWSSYVNTDHGTAKEVTAKITFRTPKKNAYCWWRFNNV